MSSNFFAGLGVMCFAVPCPKCGSDTIHFSVVPEDWDGRRALTGHVKCFECEFEPPPRNAREEVESWEEALRVMQDYWTETVGGVVLDPLDELYGFSQFCEGLYGPLGEFRAQYCESH